ncbi:MAG TPA: LysR substrate-binding domain-containing protein [Casimicrobiaceae bacterium]|nr:LysR substrate-binding domain-containing protein [Casimicrobiaceae bacterium]
MHETLRRLPSLDFLKGFEAAGRHLSFTRAAQELFLTQSALSRQVQALEVALGVPLFFRRHRALALTAAGAAFHRDVAAALGALISAADAARGVHRTPGLTLSTTVSFASLWVIPRLPAFRARHPDVEVYVSADDRVVDLGRGDVDVAVRYMADANAPEGGVRLFGERMLPVVAPKLLQHRAVPLAKPADLARHVLLHLDDPDGRMPWLDWSMWLTSNGLPGLKPAGSLRFKLYDQLIQAAVGGQGVALGRVPLIAEYLRDRRLVAPFPRRYESARGYYAVVAPHAAERSDVAAFVGWLRDEAAIAAKRAVLDEPSAKKASRALAGRRSPTREPGKRRAESAGPR